jgi:hypothetical protein
MSLSIQTSERGKVLQIETFQTTSDVWQLTPLDEGDFSRQGLTLRSSVTLSQTAISTFGFLRLKLVVDLLGEDAVTLTLKTINEEVTIGRTAFNIYVAIGKEIVLTQPFQEAHCTLQLVLNDERVGCLVIGKRIHPLLSRQPIASFEEQAYEFIVATTIASTSTVVIEELLYESVNE